MRDVATALETLVPAAKYGGSLTANTREAFDALRWEDDRPKPSWDDVEAAMTPDPAEALAQWRETATAPFADFLVALFDAGWITEAGFNDWLSRNALPADVQALIDGLSNPGERVRARRYALGAQVFERLHPLLLQIAEVKRQTFDPQPTEEEMALAVDDLFRAAMDWPEGD